MFGVEWGVKGKTKENSEDLRDTLSNCLKEINCMVSKKESKFVTFRNCDSENKI